MPGGDAQMQFRPEVKHAKQFWNWLVSKALSSAAILDFSNKLSNKYNLIINSLPTNFLMDFPKKKKKN